MGEGRSDDVVLLLKRGLNHYGLGDLEAAIASWEEARGLDPENQAVRDYLENAYEEAGRRAPDAAPIPVAIDDEDDTPESIPGLAEAFSPEPDPTPGGVEEASTRTGSTSSTPFVQPGELEDEVSFASLFESDEAETLLKGALEAYKRGELEEAWRELGQASSAEPGRLDLRAYQTFIQNSLMAKWAKEIGDQGRTLRLRLELNELLKRDLQPDEGFFVSLIDGAMTIESLIAVSSLDRFRTLEILARFLREEIVE